MEREEITFNEFHKKVENGYKPVILDVRNRDDVKRGALTDYFHLPFINIPYFEMLEESESDDYEENIKNYIVRHLGSTLNKEQPITVVCAKQGTSNMVADALLKVGYKANVIMGGMKEWGRYYQSKLVVDEKDLKIYQIVRIARGCLGYLCISGKEAIVIDPSHHTKIYKELLDENNATLKYVIDTHVHADHISGGRILSEEKHVPYFLHPYDGIHPIDMLPATYDYDFLKDQFLLKFGSSEVKSLHIPGHTLGNMAFLVNEKYLFTGDSIFLTSIARPDLGGKGDAWAPLQYRSLRHLLGLPNETLILPAHFSGPEEMQDDKTFTATLGKIKAINKDLNMALKSESDFVAFILSSLPVFPKEYIEIKRVNLGLSSPNEEDAYELEVGKNLCALKQTQTAKKES